MPTHLLPARVKHEFQRMTMGRQTSQYSPCIHVTQFTFYMVSSTFYAVDFLLFVLLTWVFIGLTFSFNRINFYLLYGQLEFLYGQLLTFYMVTSTFYRVNFLLFISVSVKADCTYQTAYCRPGVKCRLRLKCWLKTTDQGLRADSVQKQPASPEKLREWPGIVAA